MYYYTSGYTSQEQSQDTFFEDRKDIAFHIPILGYFSGNFHLRKSDKNIPKNTPLIKIDVIAS